MRGQTALVAIIFSAMSLMACKDNNDIEIRWDEWSIAHIYAQSDDRLAYGLGWSNMHNHGDLILKLYGLSRGRAAELWGRQYLESDKYIWKLWIPQIAERQYNKLTSIEKKRLNAFVGGINDYAKAHSDELDNELERVLPLTALDVVQHIMYTLYTPNNSVTNNIIQQYTSNGLTAQLSVARPEAQAASNGWAIGPQKSVGGKPLLLSNTHFPWPNLPGFEQLIWNEVHLVGESTDIYGVGLVGIPALTMGFNDTKAWTVTALSTIDVSDTYELTLANNGYLFDGKEQAFEQKTIMLKVNEFDQSIGSEVLNIKRSIQGPVIYQNSHNALAIKLAIPDNVAGLDLWGMAKAEDPESFLHAVHNASLPPLNIIYADHDGNILHTLAGALPDRTNIQYDPSMILPGDSSANLWSGYLPPERIPVVQNPQSGYLQNANESIWSVTLPTVFNSTDFPQDWPPMDVTARAASSLKMLNARERFSLDDVIHDKFSTHSELAERILNDLIEAASGSVDPVVQQAVQVLSVWDRNFDSDSVGAIVFTFWLLEFSPETVQGYPFPPNYYAVGFDFNEPLSTPRGLANPGEAVLALQRASHSVNSIFGSLYVPWGAMFHFRLYGQDIPGFGAPSSFGVFSANHGVPQPDGLLAPVAGDTWVLAIDFADLDNAMAVTSYSNVTQANSPHQGNQLSLYSNKQMRKVWRSERDVHDHTEYLELIRAQE